MSTVLPNTLFVVTTKLVSVLGMSTVTLSPVSDQNTENLKEILKEIDPVLLYFTN